MRHLRLYENFNGKTVLYLHGWNSAPHTDRTDFMGEMGVTPIAPTFDYERERWEDFVRLVESKKPDGIVGFSFGAYIGYYLSAKFKIPALLFCPALFPNRLADPAKVIPVPDDVRALEFDGRMAVISPQDNVLPFEQMKGVLRGNAEVRVEPTMTHRTQLWAFEKYFKIFCEERL